MAETQTHLAKKLKAARRAAGYKQAQVARSLGVSISAISGMENGQRRVDATELHQLALLYRHPMEWFFTTGQPNPKGEAQQTKALQPWFEDALINECVHALQKAPQDLKRRAVTGLLGFLNLR